MNRRSFFGAAASAALAPATVVSATPAKFSRVSCERDDPGYRTHCELLGDKRKIKVFLEGQHQPKGVITADANEGWIKRYVITEKGNYAHDGANLLTEVVHGRVEIVIDA